MSEAPGVTRDRAWTFDAVESVSRTFALSIDLLEEPVSSWVCTGYLLCRIADTVEDDPTIPPRVRADVLDTYDAVLDSSAETDVPAFLEAVEPVRPEDGGADWRVVDQTDRAFRVFESFPAEVEGAMRPVVREMAGGMAGFLRRYAEEGGLRLRTVDELEDYCWYVAGTVGEMFTNLLGCYGTDGPTPDPEDARAFALLLQLVNIAKDVRVDYETENNVYLPAEWLAEEGIDQEAVIESDNREDAAAVVSRTVSHARSFLDDAEGYLQAMPLRHGNTMAAWGVPFLLAVGTLRELAARPEDALTERGVKISRQEVGAVMEAMHGESSPSLSELREMIARQPFHRAVSNAD